MEILNIIRIVIEIIMFILICAACVYFVINFKRLNTAISGISTRVNEIGTDLKPVLNDISILTGKFSTIANSVVKISNNAERISGKILNKTTEAEAYIDTARNTAVSGVKNILNMIHSLKKGVSTFIHKIN